MGEVRAFSGAIYVVVQLRSQCAIKRLAAVLFRQTGELFCLTRMLFRLTKALSLTAVLFRLTGELFCLTGVLFRLTEVLSLTAVLFRLTGELFCLTLTRNLNPNPRP